VEEEPRRRVVGPRLLDPRVDALDQAGGRRQCLAEGHGAGGVVEDRDVGEGPADVDGEPELHWIT
jgi:hypothetical protein